VNDELERAARGGARRFACATLALVLSSLTSAAPAFAEAPPASSAKPATDAARRMAVLSPTRVLGEDGQAVEDPDLLVIAGNLDAQLADAAQDLGLTLDLGRRAGKPKEEADLPAQAEALGRTLIVPSVRRREGEVELRIVMAEAGSRTLRSRVERVPADDVAVRAVVMLRDLVMERRAPEAAIPGRDRSHAPSHGTLTAPAASSGRTTLALNATIFGGLLGYSVQRASGSDDPRLLYPLLAVGAGGGLVTSILVAEEWDVGVGDAWFVAAGAWWPTLAGHLIYAGRFPHHEGERWTAGIVGGMTGLTLSTLGLSLHRMREGGALLAHSGGGLGVVFGGLSELFVRGDIGKMPLAGMGYGAALGWMGMAALATQVHVSPSRVVSVDLGALIGGLGGAAMGSPLVFGHPTETQQRAWVGITAGMTLAGGAVGWLLSRPSAPRRPAHAELSLPIFGIVGQSVAGTRRAPLWGLVWQGAMP
jgi:hypothetical protein